MAQQFFQYPCPHESVCLVSQVMHDRLSMYDALQCSFLRIKKPPKQPQCQVCGPDASISSMSDSALASSSTRGPSCSTTLAAPSVPESSFISCTEYSEVRSSGAPHVLLDVRAKEQFDLCSLDGSINLPLEILEQNMSFLEGLSGGTKPIYCLCRRGIASAIATNLLISALRKSSKLHSVKNIEGGLESWRKKVDKTFPKY